MKLEKIKKLHLFCQKLHL